MEKTLILINKRPPTLTIEKASTFLSTYDKNENWNPNNGKDGIEHFVGMIKSILSDERMTYEEAVWILKLRNNGCSWRKLGDIVLFDSNQINGMDLETIAVKSLEDLGYRVYEDEKEKWVWVEKQM